MACQRVVGGLSTLLYVSKDVNSFTVALQASYFWKNPFTDLKWADWIFITEPSWSCKKSVTYICGRFPMGVSVLGGVCAGWGQVAERLGSEEFIDYTQLFLWNSCYLFASNPGINTILALPCLWLGLLCYCYSDEKHALFYF